MSSFEEQRAKVGAADGFIAALDQSGGSTPKALQLYGLDRHAWSDEAGMYDLIHAMRTRIMTSPAFAGQRILGAILFENTMDRRVEGVPSAEYLWAHKGVVPFLKVDKGLADAADGVQRMKPMPALGELLDRARAAGIFGTKMRSVIKRADPVGIGEIAAQQFDVGAQILACGLVPIIEPEIDIHCPDKAEAEAMLRDRLLDRLDRLGERDRVMLKLTLPEESGFYAPCVEHPQVLRVAALSGGYSRDEANKRLARNRGVIASFSRALTEGLSAQQSDEAFNAALDQSIDSIYQASLS